jgi:hypothetical protein
VAVGSGTELVFGKKVDVGTLKVVFGRAIGVTIATMDEKVDVLDDERLVDV